MNIHENLRIFRQSDEDFKQQYQSFLKKYELYSSAIDSAIIAQYHVSAKCAICVFCSGPGEIAN